jgi:hypothetical protein
MSPSLLVGSGLTAVIYSVSQSTLGFRGLFGLAVVPLVAILAIRRWLVEPGRFAVAAAAPEHAIRVPPATAARSPFARAVAGSGPVNSRHHQAVKDLAPGLVPLAASPDDLVEAFERPEGAFDRFRQARHRAAGPRWAGRPLPGHVAGPPCQPTDAGRPEAAVYSAGYRRERW